MRVARIALTISLAMWTVRALIYLELGSVAPAIVVGTALSVLGLGWLSGGLWWRIAQRSWGTLLVGYALLRMIIAIGLWLDPGVSAHGAEALTPFFYLETAIHLVGGLCLAKPGLLSSVPRCPIEQV